MDKFDHDILALLTQDARWSRSEIARRVGLSQPTVSERIERLESRGVVTGYSARIDPSRLGLPLLVFVRVVVDARRYAEFVERLGLLRGVEECHHIIGPYSFILKLHCESPRHLESLISLFSEFGATETTLVLSTRLDRPGHWQLGNDRPVDKAADKASD